MMKLRAILILLLGCLLLQSCGKEPDVIYKNGKIHTYDANNTIAEAIAIKDGKILEVGTNNDILGKYESVNIVDLGGKVVLPGFIDCEGSLAEFSKNLSLINLSTAKSVAEITALVNERVKNLPSDSWVGGFFWNELILPEAELNKMDKSVLDSISTTQNIYLVNLDGSIVWVNSKLLNTLKITKDTPNPKDGEIGRYEDGELNGFLFDAAVNLVRENIPEFSNDEMKQSMIKGVNELVKYGITELQDRTVNSTSLEAIKQLINEDKFPIRMYAVLSSGDNTFNEYLQKGIELNYKDKLTVRAVSIDYDGAFGLQSASMLDDYKTEPHRIVPYAVEPDIVDLLKKAAAKNFQVRVKTVGDNAVVASLNAYEKVNNEIKLTDSRTVFEHIEFADKNSINRIRDYNIIPSVRPENAMLDFEIITPKVGDRSLSQWALWNSLLQAAGKLTIGSDFPFQQINPFVNMYYLTTRQFTDTTMASITNPNEKISLDDAIRAYTIWAAYSAFQEEYKGSLEKDKFADMVVISNDIYANPKNLLSAKVEKTIINGKVVYQSGN
ncbi:MAG TPA: amidohydrolase [Ignavibacteria bacterium]|nr:amidohydrolase [Ignavibacteria bacterium]